MMKSKMRFASPWFVAVLALGPLGSAYALNPQPEPPNRHGQPIILHEGDSGAAKMRSAQPRAHSARSGAALKAGKAGMSVPAGEESAAGAGKKPGAEAAKKGYLKMDLPAVQRR